MASASNNTAEIGSATDRSVHEEGPCYRVLLVDDHPELRLLLRLRLEFEANIDVVGEASNGIEAVRLTKLLSPSAVVLDLEMPEMTGPEAIPLLRSAAPGMGILLYTAAEGYTLSDDQAPDAIIRKGVSLEEVVAQLRRVLEQSAFDIVRLELGIVPLRDAVTAFDTWAGLNMRVLDAINQDDRLSDEQLGGATPDELEALMSVYAHIGYNLQKAARAGADSVNLVVHVFRATGFLARQALLAVSDHRLPAFWKAWGYDVPDDAVSALCLMHDQLIDVLPPAARDREPVDAPVD
jgi:CheY-like chemotaxis protein